MNINSNLVQILDENHKKIPILLMFYINIL